MDASVHRQQSESGCNYLAHGRRLLSHAGCGRFCRGRHLPSHTEAGAYLPPPVSLPSPTNGSPAPDLPSHPPTKSTTYQVTYQGTHSYTCIRPVKRLSQDNKSKYPNVCCPRTFSAYSFLAQLQRALPVFTRSAGVPSTPPKLSSPMSSSICPPTLLRPSSFSRSHQRETDDATWRIWRQRKHLPRISTAEAH